MNWNAGHLPAFIAVATHGGISAAARIMGQPKSSLSRIINRLEEDVGLQLFLRGPREFTLTQDGMLFYKHAVQILEQVDAASTELAGLGDAPRGRLTVALPMAFSREIVSPHLPRFLADYPELRLDIRISSFMPDLVRDQIDMAVVVGRMTNSDLVQQTLVEAPLAWIASPEVAKSLPSALTADLLTQQVRVIETRYAETMLPVRMEGSVDIINTRMNTDALVQVNDPLIVRDMVASGYGVGLAPLIYCRAAIADGRLVQLAPHLQINHESRLSLLHPGRRLMPPKSRAFIDFLRACCSGHLSQSS